MSCIIVRSRNSTARTITRKDGTKVTFTEQKAAIDIGEEFPAPFAITLDENQEPYAPGTYYVCPSSFKINEYGGLMFGRRVKLIPLPAEKAKAA